MKTLIASLILALSFVVSPHLATPAVAQPCQWRYSMEPANPNNPNAGTATATYCGNVEIKGSVIAQTSNTVNNVAALVALPLPVASYQTINVLGYYAPGDGGGGNFYYQSTCPGTTNGGTYIAATVGCWARQLKASEPLNVKWFGAKGDNIADDTAEQQAAITAAANGNVNWPATGSCYRTTTVLIVAQPTTLQGNGNICQYTAATAALRITSSNVTVDGLTITGMAQTWPATNVPGEIAINAYGTFNAGLAPTYIENLTIRNVALRNWGAYGILAEYVNGFSLTKSNITNVVDSGAALISVQNMHLDGNTIDNITGNGTASSEAYGIAITRRTTDAGNLTSQPLSCDGTISNNIVKNIPTWNGLDTHSGCRLAYSGNTIYNTLRGYAIGASRNSAGLYAYPPLDVSISGGTIDSGLTTGAYEEGVSFTGASGLAVPATGSITGLTIRGYGNQTNVNSGAIVLGNTSGVTVAGNSILYPSPRGIALNGNNFLATLSGNTILDPFTNTAGVGAAMGIYTSGNNNQFTASGNTIAPYNKTATYLLQTATGQGIRVGAGTGNIAIADGNRIIATSPMIDAPGNVFTGAVTANGVTPVVVNAPNVTSESIINLRPTAASTGKGAFICDLNPGNAFSVCSFAGDTSNYNWQLIQ